VGLDLTLLYTDIDSGDSSFAFFSSSSLFNVEWRGSAIHIHGPDLWDNNSWDKFEMVIYHLNVAVYTSYNWFINPHIVFVKVSWCSRNEEVESLYHQWSCNIHCLAGGSSNFSLKYIYVTLFVYLWNHCELHVRLSIYNLILAILDILTEMVFLQVARIVLFVYMFYHVYLHFDQVITTEVMNFRNCLVYVVLCNKQILILNFWPFKMANNVLLPYKITFWTRMCLWLIGRGRWVCGCKDQHLVW